MVGSPPAPRAGGAGAESRGGRRGAESRRTKAAEVASDVAEAEALVRRMDLEARSLPQDKKAPLLAKLREYKADLKGLKDGLKKAEQSSGGGGDAARAELGLGGEDWNGSSVAQRERLQQTTNRIARTGDRIKQSKTTLLETEEIGVSILQNLHSQRETLTHAGDTLSGVDHNIGKSRKILGTMARRVIQNKIIMVGIIVLLMLCICLIIYFKFMKGGNQGDRHNLLLF